MRRSGSLLLFSILTLACDRKGLSPEYLPKDSGQPDTEGCPTWYTDADGDGYGDPLDSVVACTMPEGTVENDEDCDDADPQVNPAASEVCHNGVDDDCDGTPNQCLLSGIESLQQAWGQLTGADMGDEAGAALAMVGDVDGDGNDDLLVGVPGQPSAGAEAGAAYLVRGSALGASSLADSSAVILGQSAGDLLGVAVAAAGDVDGDGLADVLLGASGESAMGDDAGGAYLVLGPVSGAVSLDDAHAHLLGEGSGHQAGFAVGGGVDLTGDGYADLLVAAPFNDAGVVYLCFGPLSGTQNLSTADASITGTISGERAGYQVATGGDVNGDGYPDILISAPERSPLSWREGVVYVAYGPFGGEIPAQGAGATIQGSTYNGTLGLSLALAPDVDGDGLGDVLVGSSLLDDGGSRSGAAYLLSGPVSGTVSVTSADASFVGEASYDYAAMSLAAVGDLDGDGLTDLFFGATGNDFGGAGAGAAYLVYDMEMGAQSLAEADAKFYGVASSDSAGQAVAGGGDLDGDGIPDLAVGAPGVDDGGSSAGAVYLEFGGSAM